MSGKRGRPRIIDAHNHPDWHGHDFDRFIANMDRHGIAKTWLLSWECPEDEYDPGYNHSVPSCLARSEARPIPFSRCLAYKERAPDRFVLGHAPDPRRPDALDQMRAAIDIYGARLCGELKLRMMLDNLDAIRLYKLCGEKKVPVTVHIDYEFDRKAAYPRPNYWYGGGIEPFERAIAKCPDTIFLGHAPGFWAHISGDGQHDKVGYPKGKVVPGGKVPAMMRKYPNLHGDLSAGSGLNALQRDPEFAKDFLVEFQDRLLHARDYFDDKHQVFLNSLGLPRKVLDKIYFENAIRLVPEA